MFVCALHVYNLLFWNGVMLLILRLRPSVFDRGESAAEDASLRHA